MPLIFAGRTATLTAEAPDGGALPSNFIGIGASDGSLLHALLVESAASPNLRIRLYVGDIPVDGPIISGDNVAQTLRSLAVSSYLHEFDGVAWDRVRHSFTQSVTGITSNGAGSSLVLGTTPTGKHTLHVNRTVGAAAYTVALRGRTTSGVGWVEIGRFTSASVNDILNVVNKPMGEISYEVIIVGAGNTLIVQLLSVR